MIRAARWCRGAVILAIGVIVSAHVGSPDVFFKGRAGPYDIRVVVRPPEVVPGIARVTVRTPAAIRRVSIRPVFWRAGTRGAPSADEARRLEGDSGTFAGSLWLMARGAYSVDVIVEGAQGTANVLVPVASVATGRLGMDRGLGALLLVLGVALCAGLVTIVYKAAGESLVSPADALDAARRKRARRVAAISVPIIALGLLGGARWWGAVDRDYERAMYRPSPLTMDRRGQTLRLAMSDTVWQPPRTPSALVPDHGKLMHLFLVRANGAQAFAHLHPTPVDTSAIPGFVTTLPPLPSGRYHVFGDVVHETGFERTLVGSLDLADSARAAAGTGGVPWPADSDDAWYVGNAAADGKAALADSSTMELTLAPDARVTAGREQSIRVVVRDRDGTPASLEPYLGMAAHAVVVRLDGDVYVHLHPMGTVTTAAQDAFLARDRGDTTDHGRLRLDHSAHSGSATRTAEAVSDAEFPYAFPRAGEYRVFVQIRKDGRILTGAFAITVAEPEAGRR